MRESVLGLSCSHDEIASSPSAITPLAFSAMELTPSSPLSSTRYLGTPSPRIPLDKITNSSLRPVRKPLPRANPIERVVGEQPECLPPSRRSSALFAMDPISRSDVPMEVPVGSYATKIKVRKERKRGTSKKTARALG